MVAPDRGAVETDVGATRYRGTMFDARPEHVGMLREAGYFPASLGGVSRAKGHTCPDCGFASYFTTCSRCRDRRAAEEAAAEASGNRHLCPRREEVVGPMHRVPDHDTWRDRDGARVCSWCGSWNPDDLMAGLRAGTLGLGPTDKSYKAYVHEAPEDGAVVDVAEGGPALGRHRGKFYFQHLDQGQRQEFIALVNAKAFPVGFPGRFYVPPFFARSSHTD